jgi:phosphatidate cytidylyltransferase
MTAFHGKQAASSGDSVSAEEAVTKRNFRQRVVTSLVVGPVAVLLVFLGGWPFAVGITFLGAVAAAEFIFLADGRREQGSLVAAVGAVIAISLLYHVQADQYSIPVFVAAVLLTLLIRVARHRDFALAVRQAGLTAAAILYMGFPTGFILGLRVLDNGLVWLLMVLALTWGTDSFAYLGGRLWGHRKLAPKISPKKTVEGAIVGYVGGFGLALLLVVARDLLTVGVFIIILFSPALAILGDLFESLLKRWFGVKDSHLRGFDIFPGHGGVLDRVDALVFVVTFVYLSIRVIHLI